MNIAESPYTHSFLRYQDVFLQVSTKKYRLREVRLCTHQPCWEYIDELIARYEAKSDKNSCLQFFSVELKSQFEPFLTHTLRWPPVTTGYGLWLGEIIDNNLWRKMTIRTKSMEDMHRRRLLWVTRVTSTRDSSRVNCYWKTGARDLEQFGEPRKHIPAAPKSFNILCLRI